jgi:GrpB-like predicted nucleotidyltransferase (UPF0157 family)
MNYDSHELPQQFSAWEMYEVTAQSVSSRMTIGLYVPTAVEYLPYNSVSRRVAKSIADIIVRDKDNLTVEHIGSTAVPGCWGKGIIDLLVAYTPGCLKSARETLDRLGFQRQRGPEAFPESRPMRVGSVEHCGRNYRLHAHIIEQGTIEALSLVRFRDLLRENAELRRAYEVEKRAILARGITRGNEYSNAKGDFIRYVLGARKYQ